MHGDVPAVRRAVVVGRRHGELDAFFFAVVHALPVFEFEGAVGGDFKAAVADGVSVGIAAVGIADAQFAYGGAAAPGFDPVRGAVARVQGDGGRAVVRRAAVDIQRATERFFVVSGVVFIGGAHGDFVPGVVAGERVGLAVGISDGIAVAQPLVLHVVSGKTVAVADSRGEFAADFRLARDADAALLIGLRTRRGIVRIVLHEDIDTLLHTKAAAVSGGDGEVNNFFGGVVDVIARFQFQGAVTGYFKAAIADFVGVRVAGIGVTGREFADFRSVFAFGDFIGAEADVGRGMVGRRGIRAIIEDIHGEGVVRGTSRLSGRATDDADGGFLFTIVRPQAEVVLRIGFI